MKLFSILSIILLLLGNKTKAQSSQYFKIEKLSSNVFAFIPPRPMADMVHGNCTIIIGKDVVMVVDAFGDHIIAEEAVKEIKKITTKPVKYIITTHWHYDHVGGNRTFKMAWPSATIICNKNAVHDLKRLVIPNFKNEPKASKDLVAEYSNAIKTGMKNDSVQLTGYERNIRYPETLKDLSHFIANFSAARFSYVPPDLFFTDSLIIDMGTDSVLIHHPGWGHSPDDVMVLIKQQKILISGDIIVSPVPYAFNTIQNDWIKILKQIGGMKEVEVVVPGHGEVLRNKNYVLAVIELLEVITARIKELFDKGYVKSEAMKLMDVEKYMEKFAGNDPVRKWAFLNYFLIPRINNYYRHTKR